MRLLRTSFIFAILSLFLSISATLAQSESTADILKRMGGYPCPDSAFTCVKLTVPLDHFAADRGKTIDVVFGVLPATGERKGMFVTATGGPGTAGLMSADDYTSYFDPSIPEHFDIVFFDQRGAVQSGNFQCPDAVLTYYQTDQEMSTPEGEASAIQSAKTFANDCVKEMGVDPNTLGFYGTKQAVEDLEIFRQAIGDDKMWLYGESYGTQYAQEYAAAHPDHLAGLILDGTVDLTLSIDGYYAEDAKAFDDIFISLMNNCDQNKSCKAETAGGDALAAYDKLAAKLADGPITVKFPLASGKVIDRPLTLADLQYTVENYLYSVSERSILQRALTAASTEDYVPLLRVVYSAFVLDPETLTAVPDPSYSDALFYTVECNDYNYFSGTPDERAEAYIKVGDVVDKAVPRFSYLFYGDLPCTFWPSRPELERPSPLVAKGVPTIVLGATADAYTPLENGKRVFKHLDDAYLITTDGGPHVTFGWGNACPDEIVTAFLVDDKMPDQKETRCDGVIANHYVPHAPANAADYGDPLAAMNAAYNEIYNLPEYYYWDGKTPTGVGCPYGGTLNFAPDGDGQNFQLKDCTFSKGFAMTGTGSSSDGASDFAFDVSVTGDAEGRLSYTYDSEGNSHVIGDYAGKAVDLAS
ncbi:MAG: alpha/beta hydrolase [Chloroflexota bacterium]